MTFTKDSSVLSKKSNVVVLLIVFSIIIIIAGFMYYQHEEEIIKNEKYNELKAIAGLKINEITQWKHDRTSDAIVITHSPFFTGAVENLLKNSNNKPLKNDIIDRIVLILEQYHYENILLSDTNGNLIASAKPDFSIMNTFTISKVKEAIHNHYVTYTDFYFCSTHKKIHFDIIAPLINKDKKVIAILLLRTDPSVYLYPVIQTWPTPSYSSETLLLKREGDSVVYLNELRHLTKSVLNLKISLSHKEVPAVQAALGYKGLLFGKDYRGFNVLAYVCPVPGTPWFMVAKVDTKEIFSDLYFKASIITVLSILSILLFWAALALIYSSRQSNIYKALWQTQQEARTTLYSIGDGVLITDNNGLVKQLNPVAEQLTGWKETDADGKPVEEIFNIIHEINKNKVDNPVNKVLKDGVVVELANHTLLISKEGKEIPIADSGAPIRNQNGELIGTVLVFRDQTKERNKQKAIEESEAKYKSLFTSTNDGICLHQLIFNSDGKPVNYLILDINKRFESITGLSGKDVIGKKATDVYKSDTAPYLDVYSNTALTGKPQYFETFYEPMNKHFAISVYSPVKEKFATVFQDITVRKEAEEALRQSEQRLMRAQDIAHLGSWELDINKNILTWTDEVYRIFGLNPQEFQATYEAFLEAVHPDDREAVNEAYSGSIRDGKVMYEIEHRIVRKSNGEIRFVHEKCEHFRNSSGTVVKSIGMVHDITERKLTQLKLEETLNELKRSNRDLEQFAYIASHDLQEPLRMIKSYTDLIIKRYSDTLEGDHKAFFGYISEGATRMYQLVNALLQYSRITSDGKIFENINCNDILNDVLGDLKLLIEDSKAKILFENLPVVSGNRTMLRQLFQNMIQNSIKFRSECEPVIEISCRQKDSNWMFTIKDNGIGISPKYHDKIFLIFQRLHNRDKYPGTGIGLAVCKKIVQHHGGEIYLNSDEGKGTTFYFTLPII